MKRSVKMRILAGVSMMAVTACWSGTSVYAADEQASGDTDYLTNHTVSQTSGNIAGDLDSYNHPDRNLEIKWTDDSRGNKAPVCDGTAVAKNITIDSNFPTTAKFNWMDKGVISQSDVGSHLTASGDINITSYDDGVYTDSNGKVTIDGFKNLTIKSTGEGYGLVDNGGGITIKGGTDSTVDISTALYPAIGNTLNSVSGDSEYAIGTGISIEAGKKITLGSPTAAVFSGINKNNNFQTTLNAPEIELNGSISVGGGNVSIDDNQPGNVIIHASQDDSLTEGYSINSSVFMPNSSDTEPNSTVISINKNQGGRVQLDGGISNTGFSTVMINMTGNNSFITTVGEKDKELGYVKKNAVYTQSDAVTTLNMSGDDSYIHGDLDAETGGKITLNASGKGFKMDRSYSKSDYANLLTAYFEGSQINASISGDSSTVKGGANACNGGKINLTMNGNNAVFSGNLSTEETRMDTGYEHNDNASIQASFSGKNAKVAGDIEAVADHSTITMDVSGENSTYTGSASSIGAFITGSENPHYNFYDGTTVNLNLTGVHTFQTGNLEAEGNNTLNANYTGTGSSFTGNADNKGIMNLTLDNQSQMTGYMTNDTIKYDDDKGTTFAGKLKADFNNGSSWTGDLTNKSGTTNVGLNNGSLWNGNLSSTSGTATINLNNGSIWNGASSGNGDINLAGSSVWNLTKDSTAQSVNPDGSSVISLAGTVKKLDTQKLGGTGGTFLMDLSYHNNDVNTYRNGGGDFVVAHGGNGSAYNVSLTNNSSVNGMTDGSKLYFASTAADSSTFRMNQSVQVANYNKIYNKNLTVKKETENSESDYKGYDDWFLTPDSAKGNGGNVINPNGIVPGSAANAAFALWRDDDTLLKRLGELRYQQQDEGIWARMVNKHLERDGHHAFHGNYKTLQVGYDKKKTTANDGNWYYGGAISHLWGNTGYTDGHGSEKATAFSLYATNIRPHGHYLDLITKVGRIDSDYSTSYRDHGKFENWGTSIGAEYGRKNMLKAGWSIEPQAQLTYHYLWGDDYTTDNGAKVSQDNADSLVGRLGFVLGKDFNVGTPNVGRVYLKASVLHDFLGSTGSSITDDLTYHDDDDLGDTWYVAGIGTNIHFGKDCQFYFDAERNFNADVNMKYRFNAGFRFGF
ncbi:autotransporter outer membrane beta-barrel domain-containing protein [Mitsuokella sp.]